MYKEWAVAHVGLGSSVLMMFRSAFVQCDRNARSEMYGASRHRHFVLGSQLGIWVLALCLGCGCLGLAWISV